MGRTYLTRPMVYTGHEWRHRRFRGQANNLSQCRRAKKGQAEVLTVSLADEDTHRKGRECTLNVAKESDVWG